ncbi:MAG: DUF6036 family nucleotidyltransferase [Lachnospiraceae bacterium]|nr:DUF6036 family nucleotidyltransferase [Lachnospiraceae bacterium]
MSTENSAIFTKENLDMYLKELSKEYKKLGGRRFPVEMVLIGGAAIIESYGFRDMTTDIDAILPAVSIMKEAVNRVGDRYGLPNGWLNADFKKTDSYSMRISQYSVPYRTFNQVLHVRIVTGEYLIAMKLRAGRKYKNDLSDIVGILAEHEATDSPISYESIDNAVKNLYGSWDGFPEDSISFIRDVLAGHDFHRMYAQIREAEAQAKNVLLEFQEAYPGVLKAENIDSVLETKQDQKAAILSILHQRKQ